jgi:hypothetical protein
MSWAPTITVNPRFKAFQPDPMEATIRRQSARHLFRERLQAVRAALGEDDARRSLDAKALVRVLAAIDTLEQFIQGELAG